MNNLTELKSNWLAIKGKLKLKFAILSESDLLMVEGKQEELLSRLQERLGRNREEMLKVIAEL